jgi:hypothetical protein
MQLLLAFKKKTSKFPLEVQFDGIVLSWGFAGFSISKNKYKCLARCFEERIFG